MQNVDVNNANAKTDKNNTINGIIKKVIFRNPENGFTVNSQHIF